SSERTSFPERLLGRSSGVVVAFDQTPCRSGWPHGVRGTVDRLAPLATRVVAPWPAATIGASVSTVITMARALDEPGSRVVMGVLPRKSTAQYHGIPIG